MRGRATSFAWRGAFNDGRLRSIGRLRDPILRVQLAPPRRLEDAVPLRAVGQDVDVSRPVSVLLKRTQAVLQQ